MDKFDKIDKYHKKFFTIEENVQLSDDEKITLLLNLKKKMKY